MSEELIFGLLAVGAVFGVIGALVAGTKGNGGAGFLLGFLLGPIGILIAMLIPASEKKAAWRCPYCRGALPDGKVSRCVHCGGMFTRKAFSNPVDPVDAWEARENSGKKLPPL